MNNEKIIFQFLTQGQPHESSTRECVELSKKLNYSLSFTGYSFGAWLAEQSVFFCHKDFKKRDVRAVTFESPGSKEYLDILNTNNIESRDTNFDLIDLDIVTYLTEPNFVNTCNLDGEFEFSHADRI